MVSSPPPTTGGGGSSPSSPRSPRRVSFGGAEMAGGGGGGGPAAAPAAAPSSPGDRGGGVLISNNRRTLLIRGMSTRRVLAAHDDAANVDGSNHDGGGTVRAQEVRVRDEGARKPMSRRNRSRLFLKRTVCRCIPEDEDEAPEDGGGGGGGGGGSIVVDEEQQDDTKATQFNLTSVNIMREVGKGWRRPFRDLLNVIYLTCCCGSARYSSTSHSSAHHSSDPNRMLSNFMNFMFRSSFLLVGLIAAAAFYALVCIFAGILVGAARTDPSCISIGGIPGFPGGDGTEYADAFELSWTTFSTVGYGSYAPTTSQNSDSPSHCAFVTVICCIESFIGVLFAGFVGAILFGKITRIQSLAQIEFSHPIVIRYGGGVSAWETEEDEEEEEEEEQAQLSDPAHFVPPNKKKLTAAEEKAATVLQAAFRGVAVRRGDNVKRIPCPVLEFRICNLLHDEIGGEIMDAVLNVVASLDAEEADPALRDKLDEARASWEKTAAAVKNRAGLRVLTVVTDPIGGATAGSMLTNRSTGSTVPTGSKSVQFASTVSSGMRYGASTMTSGVKQSGHLTKSALQTVVGNLSKKDHQAVDEDPTSTLVPKRIFSKLLIEASEHPYFRRVWLARHIIDETSPLLTPRARRLVKKNHGYWPESLNSHEGVKKSIQFNQILVSLVGMSNISGSEVYAQKVYESVDCVVGYQFVNVLYRGNDGSLGVDMDLLNDVREQDGGGGEPLTDHLD